MPDESPPGHLQPAAATVTAAAASTASPAGEWRTAGCAVPRTPDTVTIGPGVTMPVTPPALDAAMAHIDGAGRDGFAGSYAGLEVDQGQVCAIVYRVPSPAFDEAIRAAAGDACVVVRDAAHSLDELTRWQQRVVDDLPMWSTRGVAVHTIGARHDGTGVEIGVQDPAQARRELGEHYGADAPLVIIGQDPVVTLPAAGPAAAPPPGP